MDLTTYQPILSAIAARAPQMEERLVEWANLNSGSHHRSGLERMAALLAARFSELGGAVETAPLEGAQGPLVHAVKRPEAPIQILLSGHFDTVYEPSNPFQECVRLDPERICGPGVADMKGGLVVMLEALRAFEQAPHASRVGWEVMLTPDEEVGSRASAPRLREAALRSHIGIVFEPAAMSGALIGSRNAIGHARVTARGRAAHAGRDFGLGRNAIVGLAEFVTQVHDLNRTMDGVLVNVGSISGGGVINIVPDRAEALLNLRARQTTDAEALLTRLEAIRVAVARSTEIELDCRAEFLRPPLTETTASRALLEAWC